MSKAGLLEACKVVGGQSALARLLGLKSQGSISDWIARERVPAERVLDIERVSGVPRWMIRPDLYPTQDSPTVPLGQASTFLPEAVTTRGTQP